MKWGAIVLGIGLLGAGCADPSFQALTTPPPGRQASLDNDDKKIVLSKGVALAFECFAAGSSTEPCESVSIHTDDTKTAVVYRAAVDTLAQAPSLADGKPRGTQNRAVFVVAGLAAGGTKLRIKVDKDDADFDVTVVP